MGIAMAAGAITGIIGTFLYPLIRKRIGLERTGLFGFFFEVMFLCLCVASIWAPGSPFDPFLKDSANPVLVCGLTTENDTVLANGNWTDDVYSITDISIHNNTLPIGTGNNSLGTQEMQQNITGFNSSGYVTGCRGQAADNSRHSFISIWLLLAGIIGARCGKYLIRL